MNSTQDFKNSSNQLALCSVFGQCGGCLYQNLSYKEELETKEKYLKKVVLEKIPELKNLFEPIVASPEDYHYRHRLDLKLIQTKDKRILVGFSPEKGRGIIEINDCPIARREIASFIPRLKEEVKNKLTVKYRQANLVIKTGDDKRVLWGGIGKKSLTLKPEEYLWTTVNNKRVFYSLDTFFQANHYILDKLFLTLKNFPVWTTETILLDLYGGVGLFSIALQGFYKYAYLIEDVKISVDLAEYNKTYHQITNLEIIQGKMEDKFDEILTKTKSSPLVAIIDPPRAGLDKKTLRILSSNNDINDLFYLSCHPESLLRDLLELTANNWQIKKIIPFDFFPKTKHIETLVYLKQKGVL